MFLVFETFVFKKFNQIYILQIFFIGISQLYSSKVMKTQKILVNYSKVFQILQGLVGKQGRTGSPGTKGTLGQHGERGDVGLPGKQGKRVRTCEYL